MTAVAPRNVATGIEALLAVPNAPSSKSPGGAAPRAVEAAFFPDLLGSIVDSAKGGPRSSSAAARPGSNATGKRPLQESKKSAGKSAGETTSEIAAALPEPNQNLVLRSLCTAQLENPWLPQDGASFPGESSGNEHGEASDVQAAAAPIPPAPAPSDNLAGSTARHVGQSGVLLRESDELADELAPAFGAAFPPPAVGGPRADRTDRGRSAAVQEQSQEPAPKRADAPASARATFSTGAQSARDLAAAAPHGSPSVSISSNAPAPAPLDRKPGIARDPAAQNQDFAARRAADTQAADSAAAAYRVATDEESAATISAGIDISDRNPAIESEPAAGRQTGTSESTSDSSPDAAAAPAQGTLAFQALLVPATAADSRLADPGTRDEGGAASGRQSARAADGPSAARSGSDDNLNPRYAAEPGPAPRVSQAESAAHAFPGPTPAASPAGVSRIAPQQGTSSAHAASPAAPDLSAWEPALQPHRSVAGGPAREIQLELRDADARVNVRLVERAGAVEVDVRTPDSHLASSLRQDLPALTSRLEQTGLRAETWHDAPADAATRIRTAEPGGGAGFQSSQNPSREGGGHDPRDGQPKEKQQKQNQPQSKEFSWLYTSLQ